MTWVRLDDGFWSDPVIDRLGNEAAGVFVRMLTYCGQHLTDGHVPPNAVRYIQARPKVLDGLEDYGLIAKNGDGYYIPKYLEFNPSKEQVEEKRRKDAERQRKARESR